MLRVGLIGCGRIAEGVHLRALARAPEVAVMALADTDVDRLAAAGRYAPEAARFTAAADLLATGDVQAVVIATPPATHADLAVAAFEAGCHVYLEKPIAPSVAAARRVLDAHQRAGTVAAVGFNYRLHPLVAAARARVAEVAPLAAVRTVFTTAARDLPAWKQRRASGGGALLDLGSHHIDLIRYLTGAEVQAVWAEARDIHEAEGGLASVHLRLTNDAIAQLFVAFGTADEDRVELVGAGGRLHYDRLRSADVHVEAPQFDYRRVAQARRTLRGLGSDLRRTLATPGDASFSRAFAAFASACRGDRPPELATLKDGLESVRVIEAAEAAAASGHVVTLQYEPERR